MTKKGKKKMLKTKLIEMESITFNDGESDKEPFIPSTFNQWEKANEYIVNRVVRRRPIELISSSSRSRAVAFSIVGANPTAGFFLHFFLNFHLQKLIFCYWSKYR